MILDQHDTPGLDRDARDVDIARLARAIPRLEAQNELAATRGHAWLTRLTALKQLQARREVRAVLVQRGVEARRAVLERARREAARHATTRKNTATRIH